MVKGSVGAGLLLGVADACVVDGLQLLDEYGLGVLNVAEGDRALAEVSFLHLTVDDVLYEVADALLGIVGQRSRCGLYGVGHHEYGLLLGEGVGAGVGEEEVIDGLVGMRVLVVDVEVLGLALPVVRGYEVAYLPGQVVLVGQLLSLGDVADDDLRALDVGETVVG